MQSLLPFLAFDLRMHIKVLGPLLTGLFFFVTETTSDRSNIGQKDLIHIYEWSTNLKLQNPLAYFFSYEELCG